MIRREAEGVVLQGYVWYAIPHHPDRVASGGEPHLQDTPFRIQPWSSYIALPDLNGTCCLIADNGQNGCLLLSEEPCVPEMPAHWTCQPAELPDVMSYDDGEMTWALEAVIGTMPFSRCHDASHLVFGGEEVEKVRIHAHKSSAEIFLWLCCEGWHPFGPQLHLRFEDDAFVDDTGNLVAIKRGDHWHTPGRFAGSRWHSPLISTDLQHPHPDQG